METALSVTHPEGESKLLESRPINLDTYAGKLNIAWEPDVNVTSLGQLACILSMATVKLDN